MKPIFFFLALFYSISCYSQALKLEISVPEPRLGESFYLTLSSDTLSKQIFNLPADKFKINSFTSFSGVGTSFSVNLVALKIGKNEVGPLTFKFNGNTYKTNTIKFTVADSLPKTDKGTWIRKVPVNDSTVYILIDQRIPAHNRITRKDDNTITLSSEINDGEKEARLIQDGIDNAKIEEAASSSSTIPDFTGKGLSFSSFYKSYRVTIIDKSKPLILTKAAFENLPDYYKFQNIVLN